MHPGDRLPSLLAARPPTPPVTTYILQYGKPSSWSLLVVVVAVEVVVVLLVGASAPTLQHLALAPLALVGSRCCWRCWRGAGGVGRNYGAFSGS